MDVPPVPDPGAALKDAQGTVVQWFGTNTDVDELKRTAEALRNAEARLRIAHQAANIGASSGTFKPARTFGRQN